MSISTAIKNVSMVTAGAAFIALGSVAPSMAITVNYNGTTVNGPTWNRPIENASNPPTFLSGVGTAVSYSVQQFFVATNNAYNFLSTAVSPAGWDNYLFLYRNSFNPNTPLTNVVIGNDDYLTNIGQSGFNNVSLTAGTQYYLVTTGFFNSNAGSFINSITGSGNITLGNLPVQPVPEPATILGTLISASFGVGLRRRFKQQRKTIVKA